MKNILALAIEKREKTGKEVTKKLRLQGFLPVEIYSKGNENVHGQINEKDFVNMINKTEAGIHSLFELEFEGDKKHAFVHDYQMDCLTDRYIHLDMINIDIKKKVTTKVSVRLAGEAPAIKKGGVLVHNLHEIEVEALPTDIPPYIAVDISGLVSFHDGIHIKDLEAIGDVIIKDNLEALVVHIEGKRGLKDEDDTVLDALGEEVAPVDESASAEDTKAPSSDAKKDDTKSDESKPEEAKNKE